MILRKASFAVLVVCFAVGAEAVAQPSPVPGGLLSRTPWCRLEVVAGRIQLVDPRLGHKATVTAESPDGRAKELLSFCATDVESVSVRYEYLDEREHWLVDVELSRQVSIERRPRNDGTVAKVHYRQPRSGTVSVLVEQDGATRQAAAADFWRLMLSAPDLCRQHLTPVLESLRPDWRLNELGQQVERTLFEQATGNAILDRQVLDHLILQLGDREFHRRQSAERQLRELGQRVVSHLNRVNQDHLNAEQRFRLARIQQSLQVRDGDTPLRVAAWLIDDPATWISLLDRQDQRQRVTAARHLEKVLGKPLDFDALAADPKRAQQLARLRNEYGMGQPALVGDRSSGPTRF
ncbi:MAG: hypothetical protein KJ000_10420 [Pirellulaceae bacterium]|nr:hypothetical protein [Pirellulaceae bacterium]